MINQTFIYRPKVVGNLCNVKKRCSPYKILKLTLSFLSFFGLPHPPPITILIR